MPVELAVKVAAGVLQRRLDRPVWFAGELVHMTAGRGGQSYAVLRGTGAKIEVYVPATHARHSGGVAAGTVVIVQGRLRIWQRGGRFEIAATSALLPTASIGARADARFASERELRAEGVFERPRRDLPRWPEEVAVVTSGRGAAIHDVRAVIERRAPWVSVRLHDCTVQGVGAVPTIITALDEADRSTADLILLTRGGGSPDMMDPFDNPDVVRRVASSRLPIIVAVGHQPDLTLADRVADRSTSTPTSAAEISVPDREAIHREIRDYLHGVRTATRAVCSAARSKSAHSMESCQNVARGRVQLFRERALRAEPRALVLSLERLVQSGRQHLTMARTGLRGHARGVVRDFRRRLLALRPALFIGHAEATIGADRHRADDLIRATRAMSPEHVLKRGYALLLGGDGSAIRGPGDVEPGQTIQITLRDGTVAAVVVASMLSGQPEVTANGHDSR